MQTIQNGSSITIENILTKEELDSIATLLLSYGKIGQVYFKDKVDNETIDKVRYILESSDQDSLIDKIVLLDGKRTIDVVNTLITQNPNTWQIAYQKEGNRYKLTTLPKYRNMNYYINNVVRDTELVDSQLEKIMVVYDEIRKYTVLPNTFNDKIPDDIISKKGSQSSLVQLFGNLLTQIGINNYKLDYKGPQKKNKSLLMVLINDEKYNINGLYFFAPLEEVNKETYHFFCIDSQKFFTYNKIDKVTGVMELLSLDDSLAFDHKLKFLKSTNQDDEVTKIEEKFEMSCGALNQKLRESPKIKLNALYHIYLEKEKQTSIKAMSEKKFIENSSTNQTVFNKKIKLK